MTIIGHLVLGLNSHAESLSLDQVQMKVIVSPLLPEYLWGEGPCLGLKEVPALRPAL